VAFTDLHFRHGAGVIAALSPQAAWDENKRQAEALLAGEPVRNTAERLDKATDIACGIDPEYVLGGPKTRAFYGCILDPVGHPTACIDRHMVRAALKVSSDAEIKLWAKRAGVYDLIAEEIGKLAKRYSQPVSTIQAVIWGVVRDKRQGRTS
jgi:hypothetical protein